MIPKIIAGCQFILSACFLYSMKAKERKDYGATPRTRSLTHTLTNDKPNHYSHPRMKMMFCERAELSSNKLYLIELTLDRQQQLSPFLQYSIESPSNQSSVALCSSH